MVDAMTAKDIAAKDITGRLRAVTWPVHERLHLHPVLRPLTARHPTMDGYLGAVRALYGFVAPMERRLGDKERELREIREERAYKAAARVRRIVRRG